MTNAQKRTMAIVLDAVDSTDEGLDLDEARKVFEPVIGFKEYVRIVNALALLKLISIDSDHIARRVRT